MYGWSHWTNNIKEFSLKSIGKGHFFVKLMITRLHCDRIQAQCPVINKRVILFVIIVYNIIFATLKMLL